LRAEAKEAGVTRRYTAVILARVLGRVFAPNFYPWLFGLLQLGLVVELGHFWPLWIPIAGGIALALLLTILALVRDRWRLKGMLLVVVIGLLTVGPTISAMVTRARIGITGMEQDSAIQTELAVERFLHGGRIYGSDWSTTVLAKMPWPPGLGSSNPALHHFVYFPLTFLSAIPVRLISSGVGLPFDYRMVILLFLGLGLLAAWFLPIPAADRFAIAVALFLNPLVTLFLWAGRNDLCFATLILLALGLLARGRPVLASLTIGFASAFKLFAAPAIPVMLVVLWLRYRRDHDRREVVLSLLAMAAFPVATILPFLLQAPTAFIRDVVLYPGGGLADSYPIAGFGFGAALLLLGLVHRQDYFPFGLFQAAAMAAAAWFGLRALLARPTLRRWMVAYVALFFGLAFFARYFNDSHFGVLVAMALCCRPLGDHRLLGLARRLAFPMAA
jgi:Glycosyltransferase family 87